MYVCVVQRTPFTAPPSAYLPSCSTTNITRAILLILIQQQPSLVIQHRVPRTTYYLFLSIRLLLTALIGNRIVITRSTYLKTSARSANLCVALVNVLCFFLLVILLFIIILSGPTCETPRTPCHGILHCLRNRPRVLDAGCPRCT